MKARRRISAPRTRQPLSAFAARWPAWMASVRSPGDAADRQPTCPPRRGAESPQVAAAFRKGRWNSTKRRVSRPKCGVFATGFIDFHRAEERRRDRDAQPGTPWNHGLCLRRSRSCNAVTYGPQPENASAGPLGLIKLCAVRLGLPLHPGWDVRRPGSCAAHPQPAAQADDRDIHCGTGVTRRNCGDLSGMRRIVCDTGVPMTLFKRSRTGLLTATSAIARHAPRLVPRRSSRRPQSLRQRHHEPTAGLLPITGP